MSPHTGTTIRPYRDKHPHIDRSAIVLDGVRIIGDVTLGPGVSLWYNTVVRGDVHWVRIGSDTNIQDGSILHVTREDHPLSIGCRVTVGHGVCLHGCTIHDEALIGMGSTVLDGAVVESRSMVAAGALVPPGMVVQEGTLVGGVPARVLRTLRDEELLDLPESARRYCGYARDHAAVMPW